MPRELRETRINPDVSMFHADGEHFGSVMRTGKSWVWTHVESNRFGFTDSKADAVELVRRIFISIETEREKTNG